MALSEQVVDLHIEKWQIELDGNTRPYRKNWPSKLFHHCPIENAAQILRDGNLRARNDRRSERARDIAAAGVIDTNSNAHDYARLYFRPKTPTQWHVEGVRKHGECQFGEEAHAPVLVMLVFDAKRTLTREGVLFSNQNMQINGTMAGSDAAYFNEIPFDKVYHEGPTGGDNSIKAHRCAEVLAPSPFPLREGLQHVLCRSSAERETLLHLLGPDAEFWKDAILVSDDALVFCRQYSYVESVGISSKGVLFKITSRHDHQTVDLELQINTAHGSHVSTLKSIEFSPKPAQPATRWIYEVALPDGAYHVLIRLEGQLAYEGVLTLGDDLI